MKKKNKQKVGVLIISHNFPVSHIDMHGKRAVSISKYLQEEEFEITLLTSVKVDNLSKRIVTDFNIRNYYSAKSFPIKKFGYKTKILVLIDLLKLNNLLFFPDMCFTWIRKAVRKGKRIIKQNRPDLIYAIMNPYSSFVVAYKLSKKYDIPLILDYSDPYSCHPFNPIKNRFLNRRRINLEKKIFDYSVLKICIGEECANLIKNCLDRKNSKFEIINTGFFEEFRHEEIVKGKIFTISYLGNFYGIMKPLFSNFVSALNIVNSAVRISNGRLKFVYAGGVSRKVIGRMIEGKKLKNSFIDLGIISQEECYVENQRSHLSLYLSPEKAEYVLPTKVFDYAASNTHVLVIGERCATTKFFDEIEQKYTLVNNDVNSIRKTFCLLYLDWKRNILKYGCNEEKLVEYSRRNQIQKLSKILEEFKCIKK